MAIYLVELKPLSVLTKIPDAQTIFGAFCYKYKEIYGEEKLEFFIEQEKSNKPAVLFSSMFYKDVLPLPLNFNVPLKKGLSLDETIKNKKIKKLKYISKLIYNEYANDKEKFEENFYLNLESKYEIVNNDILAYKNELNFDGACIVSDIRTRNAMTYSVDKKLFKDEVFYCNERLTFNIFINILNDDFKEEILNTFKLMKYTFFGGQKSIGYNLFEFKSIKLDETINCNKTNMLLSKAVIDTKVNINDSYYKVELIKNKFNVQGSKLERKQINTFVEGSVISTTSNYIGGIIEEEQDGKKTYQYYIGMLI